MEKLQYTIALHSMQSIEREKGMNLLFTPYDIVRFFVKADFTITDQTRVLDDFLEYEAHWITPIYKKDKQLLRRRVHHELAQMQMSGEELKTVNHLFEGMGQRFVMDDIITVIMTYDIYEPPWTD